MLTEDDARMAIDVAFRFWVAVGGDDDEACRRLLMSVPAAILGREPGLAQRIRHFRQIARQDCSRLGHVTPVEIIEGEGLRLLWRVADRAQAIEPGTHLWVWRIELERENGVWLVDPLRPPSRAVIGTVTVDVDEGEAPAERMN